MNTSHLATFVWLRSRIRVNQLRRGGIANQVILLLLTVMAVMAAVGLFVGGFVGGLYGLPKADATGRLFSWDGVVATFLFMWMIGLLTDIQRSDPLTLDRFLHLPVSPSGVFVINYLSSLASLTLLLFVAGMTGLLLGQLFSVGPVMLLGFVLLAAFVFAGTAMTYQFQGWLAVLMSNPRRRRTIVVFVTLGVVLVAQTPNLINLLRPWKTTVPTPPTLVAPAAVIPTKPGETPPTNPQPGVSKREVNRETWEQAGGTAWLLNAILPPGWLPYGLASLPDGEILPTLLGTLGFTAIGGGCLWRAYRTTVKYHTGQFATGGEGQKAAKVLAPLPNGKPTMVEWQLPRVSEHAAAVAAGSLRGMLRAPETKMLLIVPVILAVVLGGLLIAFASDIPQPVRPLIAVGLSAFVFLTGVQVAGNQFGYDRAGFRAFVLAPIPRRELLLGKNLALAPILLGIGVALALVVGAVLPMRVDHYPMVLAQLATMYLLYCLLMNFLSIVAPMAIAAGAMQPTGVKLGPVLWQFGFMMVYPPVVGLVLLPVGIEVLVEKFTEIHWLPIGVVLSFGLLVVAVLLYRRVLAAQGDWLARREKDILLVVTSKVE